MQQSGNLDELRYWLVQQWIKMPLENKQGEKFGYDNMNYVIASVIVERIEGKSWEEIIV